MRFTYFVLFLNLKACYAICNYILSRGILSVIFHDCVLSYLSRDLSRNSSRNREITQLLNTAAKKLSIEYLVHNLVADNMIHPVDRTSQVVSR